MSKLQHAGGAYSDATPNRRASNDVMLKLARNKHVFMTKLIAEDEKSEIVAEVFILTWPSA